MCSVDNINVTFRGTVIMNYLLHDLLLVGVCLKESLKEVLKIEMLTFKH